METRLAATPAAVQNEAQRGVHNKCTACKCDSRYVRTGRSRHVENPAQHRRALPERDLFSVAIAHDVCCE